MTIVLIVVIIILLQRLLDADFETDRLKLALEDLRALHSRLHCSDDVTTDMKDIIDEALNDSVY